MPFLPAKHLTEGLLTAHEALPNARWSMNWQTQICIKLCSREKSPFSHYISNKMIKFRFAVAEKASQESINKIFPASRGSARDSKKSWPWRIKFSHPIRAGNFLLNDSHNQLTGNKIWGLDNPSNILWFHSKDNRCLLSMNHLSYPWLCVVPTSGAWAGPVALLAECGGSPAAWLLRFGQKKLCGFWVSWPAA